MDDAFDVAVIGGGINGAAVAYALSVRGWRVVLLDRGDFGGGTSQASTMLVWGGLLYLKDLELRTVLALCRDRDALMADHPEAVRPAHVAYFPGSQRRGSLRLTLALQAYWACGRFARRRPARVAAVDEHALLAGDPPAAYEFDEGALVDSDARFVLGWVLAAEAAGATVRNHTAVAGCAFDAAAKVWRLELSAPIDGATSIRARAVVNAAGVWADALNRAAGVATPYRHVLSRGVSIAVPRHPRHTRHLVFDADDGNVLTLAPWGPVALWASTESLHPSLEEAQRCDAADVAYLLDHYNCRFRARIGVEDVQSLRVGVRPVAVAAGARVDARGLGLSRHHRLHLDGERRWLTVFGGKLSGCRGLADEARRLIGRTLPPPRAAASTTPLRLAPRAPDLARFPGVDTAVVSPRWARTREHCRTVEDYLRRRTNVAQWIARGGFGRHDEHAAAIHALARELHADEGGAAEDVRRYRAVVEADGVLLTSMTPGATAPPKGVFA